MKKAMFLADAHLHSPEASPYRQFVALLERQQGRLDALFLLGDIFEFITGRAKTLLPEHQPALKALAALRAAGTQVVWVEGNHDFGLAPAFHDTYGFDILPDGGRVEWEGLTLQLCHGDTLNPQDQGYRCLRALLRSRPLLGLLDLAPASLSRAISSRAVADSQRRRTSPERPLRQDLLEAHARRHWRSGADVVLCGHYHRRWELAETGNRLFLLDAWCDQPSCLILEGGHFRWEDQPG